MKKVQASEHDAEIVLRAFLGTRWRKDYEPGDEHIADEMVRGMRGALRRMEAMRVRRARAGKRSAR